MPDGPQEPREYLGKAISLAVYEFGAGFRGLPFHDETSALRSALESAGYDLEVHDGLSAAELGTAVRDFLKAPGPQARIVHVLTHSARPQPDEQLHAVGCDGRYTEETNVLRWLSLVDTYTDEPPYTLFLLDLCNAGQAAWPDWIGNAVAEHRAWVIAATHEQDAAYNARLTGALAEILGGLSAEPPSLDLDTRSPYVPFDVLVASTRALVDVFGNGPGALPQRVTATPYDGSYPPLPFFRNPRAPVAAVQLDEILDIGHWQRASTGRLSAWPHKRGVGFTGRARELGELVGWLDATLDADAQVGWLYLVTGRRGSGKSALLGILVCATHEDFGNGDDQIWLSAFGARAPSRHPRGRFAVAHVRRRGLMAVLRSLARQLRLDGQLEEDQSEASMARSLRDAIAMRPDPPVIVMDAVDEGDDPVAFIDELIRPLAAPRPDGRPLAYCLIGIRDEEYAEYLRPLARELDQYVDLESIAADTLRKDVSDYVATLVRMDNAYAGGRFTTARPDFAAGVASSLTDRAPDRRGGEFLIAGLYTHHVLSLAWPAFEQATARERGAQVPRDLSGVLEMDLGSRAAVRPWRRPLLAALAHTYGAGMPAEVVRTVAGLWGPAGPPPEPGEVREMLDGEGFYLRVSADTDGTVLYRLYNQGLDEHLKGRPGDGDRETRPGSLLDAILRSAHTTVLARPQWSEAGPYVRRHAAQHADDEGRLPELLADPGFLIHVDVDLLNPLLARQETRPSGPEALLLRMAPARLRDLSFGDRRQLLGLEAMRWGQAVLSRDLIDTPARGAPKAAAAPLWSSGSNLDARQVYLFTEHKEAVNTVIVADLGDRRVTVSAGADGTIRLADLHDGRPLGEPMVGHTAEITAMAACTLLDQPVLLTGSADQTVRMWDLRTLQPLGEPFVGHTDMVTALTTCVIDRELRLVTGSADTTVRVWDLRTRQPLGEPLTGHTDTVTALAVGTIGRKSRLISGSADRTVRIWDPADHRPTGEPLVGHTDTVTALAVCAVTGKPRLITGSADRTVRMWDLASRRPVGGPRRGHADTVTALIALRLAGKLTVFSADATGQIRRWPVRGFPASGAVLRGHAGAVTAMGCDQAEDPTMFVTAGSDGTVRGWDLTTPADVAAPPPGHSGPVRQLGCFAFGDRRVGISAASDRTVRFWELGDGSPVEDLPAITVASGPTSVGCSPDGRLLVVGTQNGSVLVHRLDGPSLVFPPPSRAGVVTAVACTTVDGVSYAVTTHQEGTAQIWNLDAMELVGSLSGHTAAITSVTCTVLRGVPTAVTTGYDRTVRLWDLLTGKESGRLTGHTAAITSVACIIIGGVPNAVTAGADGTVRLWDLLTGEESGCLTGHTDTVTSVVCTVLDSVPTALTTSWDRTARLWDLTTGRQVVRLVFPEIVQSGSWLPGERLLVGFGMDVAAFYVGGLYDDDDED
ncbi:WD40 repeat domain-containing protein [Streptomyces sp. NBC_00433]